MPIKGKPWFELSDIGCLLLLALTLLYTLPPSLDWPLLHDGPIQHYIAWRILNGAVPYRDLFDMNMPGIYLLHMLCLFLFGSGDVAFRLFDLAFIALSATAIIAFGRRQSKFYAWLGALFFTVLHLHNGPTFMGQRDFMLVPFLLFSAYLLKCFLETGKAASMFRYGLLMGFAFWMKPTVAIFILMCCAILLSWPLARARKMAALGWMALGGAIPAALIHAWLYLAGGLAAFYDIFLHFTLPLYAQMHPQDWRINLIAFSLLQLSPVLVLFYFLYKSERKPAADKIIVAAGLLYGVVHFYAQGKGWVYHIYPLWAFIGLYLTQVPSLQLGWKSRVLFHSLLFAACFFLLPWFALADPYYPYKEALKTYSDEVVAARQEAMQSVPRSIRLSYRRTPANERIQFFDFTSAALWNVGYRQGWIVPTHHIYPFPFYGERIPAPYIRKLERQLLRQLSARPPLVIFISKESWPFEDKTLYHILETQPPWQDRFAKHYRLVKEMDRYRVYARIK